MIPKFSFLALTPTPVFCDAEAEFPPSSAGSSTAGRFMNSRWSVTKLRGRDFEEAPTAPGVFLDQNI